MLSENVKKFRLEQRYTRKQLGSLVGVSATTIQSIETGMNDNPSLRTLKGLSKALKVSIMTLIK